MMQKNLVARIKKSSKYTYQSPAGDGWFDVTFVGDSLNYNIIGNNNRYPVCDLQFGVRLDGGGVIDLVSGKTTEAQKSLEATS